MAPANNYDIDLRDQHIRDVEEALSDFAEDSPDADALRRYLRHLKLYRRPKLVVG